MSDTQHLGHCTTCGDAYCAGCPDCGACQQACECERVCTICQGNFDLFKEGGVEGFIGILPVAFCPTCKAGIFDFVEQLTPPYEEMT